MHFTPTGSSWANQVERWCGFLTDDMIRRGAHKSVQALEADIRAWVAAWNDNPKPSHDSVNESQARDTRSASMGPCSNCSASAMIVGRPFAARVLARSHSR